MQVHGFLGLIVFVVALLSPVGAVAQPRSPSAPCDWLASVALPNTTVASAQMVPAGQFTPPGAGAKPFADLPLFCRVVGSTRMLNSDVKFEIGCPSAGRATSCRPAATSGAAPLSSPACERSC